MLPTCFESLAKIIQNRHCPHKLRLVGVDGPSGAGKSTFAKKLALALSSAPVAEMIVEMDDFLAWDDLESFEPRLEQQLIEPLFAGRCARYQVRDWENDNNGRGLGDWKEQPFVPCLLLEGVGSTRAALHSRLHYRIWVDAPEPLCIERGHLRDRNVAGYHELWKAGKLLEATFFRAQQTRSRADLLVDGSKPYEQNSFALSSH